MRREAVRSGDGRIRAVRRVRAACLRAADLSRRLRRDEAATAAVESGLLFPLLLLGTLGVIEMGRLMYAHNTVSHAAMEGARYAIVHGATSASPASSSEIRDYVTGRITGLDPAAVSVAVSWDQTNHPGYPVTVRVDYDFGFFFDVGLGSLTLSRASTMVISR